MPEELFLQKCLKLICLLTGREAQGSTILLGGGAEEISFGVGRGGVGSKIPGPGQGNGQTLLVGGKKTINQ